MLTCKTRSLAQLQTPISLITISKLQGIVPEAEQYTLDVVVRPHVYGNMFTIDCLAEDQLRGFDHQVIHAACRASEQGFWEKEFCSYLFQARSNILTCVHYLSVRHMMKKGPSIFML